jgi:hypothetical protein
MVENLQRFQRQNSRVFSELIPAHVSSPFFVRISQHNSRKPCQVDKPEGIQEIALESRRQQNLNEVRRLCRRNWPASQMDDIFYHVADFGYMNSTRKEGV